MSKRTVPQLRLPKTPGLYAAFVHCRAEAGGERAKPKTPNALIEIVGEAPYLRARLVLLAGSQFASAYGDTIELRGQFLRDPVTVGHRISLARG